MWCGVVRAFVNARLFALIRPRRTVRLGPLHFVILYIERLSGSGNGALFYLSSQSNLNHHHERRPSPGT